MATMERRDALKALAGIAGATGMTVTPIAAEDAKGVELVLIKSDRPISNDTAARLKEFWLMAVQGTSLEHAKVAILSDGLAVEFVRTT